MADRERLRDLYLARSHELALARGEARRAELAAARARAERRTTCRRRVRSLRSRRVPARLASRSAVARRSACERTAGCWPNIRRRSPRGRSRTPRAGRLRGRLVNAARPAAQAAIATRLGRAYTLGEAALSDWLLARRHASEAQQQAMGARLEAIEAAARLRLDLHELAGFDD
jgi:hypothetical protein